MVVDAPEILYELFRLSERIAGPMLPRENSNTQEVSGRGEEVKLTRPRLLGVDAASPE
jgi:hypothetical protein